MFRKVINKLKEKLAVLKRTVVTKINSLLGLSDKSRWKQIKSLHANWDERTAILAKRIKPNSKVFEFGAGRLSLEEMLPQKCEYLHSDIVRRNESTMVIDLNKELPDIPLVNYVIFSGVLEYIYDVDKLLIHISQYADNMLISYATTEAFPNLNKRRFHGRVSDLSDNAFKVIAKEINWKVEIISVWKGQTLYYFKKEE